MPEKERADHDWWAICAEHVDSLLDRNVMVGSMPFKDLPAFLQFQWAMIFVLMGALESPLYTKDQCLRVLEEVCFISEQATTQILKMLEEMKRQEGLVEEFNKIGRKAFWAAKEFSSK